MVKRMDNVVTDSKRRVAKSLKERGEGLFHITLESDDSDVDIKKLKKLTLISADHASCRLEPGRFDRRGSRRHARRRGHPLAFPCAELPPPSKPSPSPVSCFQAPLGIVAKRPEFARRPIEPGLAYHPIEGSQGGLIRRHRAAHPGRASARRPLFAPPLPGRADRKPLRA